VTSGGARARSGPPPDRLAIRNGRSGADWIRLPATGRKGDPPAWPSAVPRPTRAELAHWAEEWKRPQAIMWEANGQELEIALFVRAVRIAVNPKAKSGERNLVKQLFEHLGLSQPGLARNHWIIDSGSPEEAQPSADNADQPIAISDARERLRAAANAG